MTPAELVENFSFLDNWEEKYSYLIDLEKTLPFFPEDAKNDINKVSGCQSQVWLTHLEKEGRHFFAAHSDAVIVRGLAAVLLILVNGKTTAEIQQIDFAAFMTTLGLEEHLSPTRRNGFFAMIGRIRSFL